MATPTNTSAAFAPLTIGTTPAGSVWTARCLADVAPMTARLEGLWSRHNAKQAARRSIEDANARTLAGCNKRSRKAFARAWTS